VVNYAGYRLVYVAVSAGQKNFGSKKKKLLRENLTTPNDEQISEKINSLSRVRFQRPKFGPHYKFCKCGPNFGRIITKKVLLYNKFIYAWYEETLMKE